MNDIFDYDFFDEAYEDVDIFDENYFEAMEGNKENKLKRKTWEYERGGNAVKTAFKAEDTYENRMKLARRANKGDVRTLRRHRDDPKNELARELELSDGRGGPRSGKLAASSYKRNTAAFDKTMANYDAKRAVAEKNPKLVSSDTFTGQKASKNMVKNFHVNANQKPTEAQRAAYIKRAPTLNSKQNDRPIPYVWKPPVKRAK